MNMKRNNTKIVISIFCSILLGLTACTSKPKTIEGKYVSIYDETEYLLFNKDGSFVNSLWTVTHNGQERLQDCLRYSIDEKNIITVIDTTEYFGQDELDEYELGIMYKDYICISWNGKIPKNYENFTITSEIPDAGIIYRENFKDDKTFEYTITSSGEVVQTKNGTYSINNNEVICTYNDGMITTFIDIKGNTYSIEYVKE